MKLIAIDGDLSANGMSETATTLECSPAQAKLVFALQELNQKVYELLCQGVSSKVEYDKMKAVREKINCFPSKWHYRTTWAKAV